MKLNKLGYTKVDLIIVVVLITIVAFITINKTALAFENNNAKYEEEMIALIEEEAKNYAMDNLEIFNENTTAFIIVNDLVENNYMFGNSDGLVVHPSDPTKNYNDNKIKLEYDQNKNQVKATFGEFSK